MDLKNVYSSTVERIGHEADRLVVHWRNGKVSAYDGVPAQVAGHVTSAWSVGKALREHVIGKYDHSYLEG